MKRLAAAVALALCAAAPAGAHPGHGAESVTVDGDAFRYEPAEVTIGVGESVFWFWQGLAARNHSVTADPGQAESFDSDPAGPPTNETHPAGDSFAHTFSEEGRFTYHCRVHSQMTGVVNVVPIPVTNPLRVKDLRVKDGGNSVRVQFFVSKKADLVLRITHWGKAHWRSVDTLNRNGRKGRNKFNLSADSLGTGRFRMKVTAYDALNGRASAEAPFSLAAGPRQ